MRITKQSPVCGARSCHSMDSIISVLNKDFTGDGKEFNRIIGAVAQAESCIHRQLDGVRESVWNHRTSTLQRSETNDTAGRAVRRVKEGSSAVLSGLDEKWLSDSVECYCYLRNVQDLMADGKTLYERRYGEPFKGPIIPFGAMVEYHPISSRDFFKNSSIWQERITRYLSWL